ncbi:MAG: MBL fold metallo-hydrolase [Nitrospinota bacterium]|nr:MBL fold metallo-hydrolase [Nitrospinota bacterium]
MFRFSILSSGSKGNCIYIESLEASILIDAGLSQKELVARLHRIQRKPEGLHAVFLTHGHSDHVKGVGPLVRKYGLPVYCTEGTHEETARHRIADRRVLKPSAKVAIGDLTVEAYPTPHDAAEPVAFIVHQGKRKLAQATDLGTVTPLVREKLLYADALLLEANHDVEMLDAGAYPWPLKQRIKSDLGHLSNDACADLLSSVNHEGLQTVVLMHLSENNNHPEIASLTVRQALKNRSTKMILARQDRPTELLAVR